VEGPLIFQTSERINRGVGIRGERKIKTSTTFSVKKGGGEGGTERKSSIAATHVKKGGKKTVGERCTACYHLDADKVKEKREVPRQKGGSATEDRHANSRNEEKNSDSSKKRGKAQRKGWKVRADGTSRFVWGTLKD